MDFSVGDFAEQMILNERAGTSNAPSSQPAPVEIGSNTPEYSQRDISQVEVPANFVQGLLEGREVMPEPEPVMEEPEPVMEEPEPVIETPVEESDMQGLLEEVRDLLKEVSSQLNEMTTVGMGGAGASETKPRKKKENALEDNIRNILKNRRKVKSKT